MELTRADPYSLDFDSDFKQLLWEMQTRKHQSGLFQSSTSTPYLRGTEERNLPVIDLTLDEEDDESDAPIYRTTVDETNAKINNTKSPCTPRNTVGFLPKPKRSYRLVNVDHCNSPLKILVGK